MQTIPLPTGFGKKTGKLHLNIKGKFRPAKGNTWQEAN
jgi:hypothetical protein